MCELPDKLLYVFPLLLLCQAMSQEAVMLVDVLLKTVVSGNSTEKSLQQNTRNIVFCQILTHRMLFTSCCFFLTLHGVFSVDSH